MFDREILDLAKAVLDAYRARGWRLATAEACTGGSIAAALTAITGASDVVECGFVVYSNAAKAAMLGIAPATLASHGAVSPEMAAAMAEAAVLRAGVEAAVAVTGLAGPGGGSAEKPLGLVFFSTARRGGDTRTERHQFQGDRDAVRRAALIRALELLLGEAKPD